MVRAGGSKGLDNALVPFEMPSPTYGLCFLDGDVERLKVEKYGAMSSRVELAIDAFEFECGRPMTFLHTSGELASMSGEGRGVTSLRDANTGEEIEEVIDLGLARLSMDLMCCNAQRRGVSTSSGCEISRTEDSDPCAPVQLCGGVEVFVLRCNPASEGVR